MSFYDSVSLQITLPWSDVWEPTEIPWNGMFQQRALNLLFRIFALRIYSEAATSISLSD